jgi:DNA-binding response OmpR family regulator
VTIVIAEDDESLLELLVYRHAAEGYGVVAARDGRELLSVLARLGSAVDLVVSDLNLPRSSGLEALAFFRRQRYDAPFVLVTGEDPSMVRAAARTWRPSAVVPKPVDLEALLALTRRLLA